MTRRVLDLFCGEGGAARGYADAGLVPCGIDVVRQPLYPYAFHHGDAIAALRALLLGGTILFVHPDGSTERLGLGDFAAIHASPPCQAHSTITPDKSKHVDLIPPTRELLVTSRLPYVIENVEGARRHLIDPVRICGSGLGLKVRRHRYFESNVALTGVACDHARQGTPVGVYGQHGDARGAVPRPGGTSRGGKARDVHEAREVMGMPWASWKGCAQAIPPAYAEHLGRALIAAL